MVTGEVAQVSTSMGNSGALAGEGFTGPVNGTRTRSRMCPSCGRGIEWDASSCPYCMWTFSAGTGLMAVSEPISSGKRVLLYVASLLIPLFGIILGAIYILRKDEEHTSVGTICLVLGVIAAVVVLPTILALILYLMVLGI